MEACFNAAIGECSMEENFSKLGDKIGELYSLKSILQKKYFRPKDFRYLIV
jgi:hypothetical protein